MQYKNELICIISMKIIVPNKLSEIKLHQYQSFLEIKEPTNEDILKCFLDVSDDVINRMKLSEVKDIAETILQAFESNTNTFVQKISFNGFKLGFIPNLDDISYGENKDVTTYINDWAQMNKAMAVLYRPITNKQGAKYLIEDYKGSHVYSELMKDMPLDVVFGALVFFWTLTNDLLQAIPNYLHNQMKIQQKAGQVSEVSGEAIQKYIHSLKATLDDLTKLQRQGFTVA